MANPTAKASRAAGLGSVGRAADDAGTAGGRGAAAALAIGLESPQDRGLGERHPLVATFLENRLGALGLAFIAAVIAFCFLGPLMYHSDQIHANIQLTNLGPGSGRPLGTDDNGFDILGRLMVGGQSALEVGLGVALLATTFGALWGAVAGFVGGWLDALLMRIVDVLIAVPAIFILIYLSTAFRPTVRLLILVLSLLSWLGPARLIRGETLSLRTREFVEAVKVSGGRLPRIIGRHIIPNTVGTISVNASFQVADAIITLAALNFLGFGLPPPAVTWGGMLSQGTTNLLNGYWWQVYPVGAILTITVVAFNFVGEALRETLDARLRRR
jgi:peptide/nickel transport system permease protein